MHAIAQPHVHRWRTHYQPSLVHVRAVLQTEHVRTVVQHKHVMVTIRLAVVPLRGGRVMDARHGAHVRAAQSALHAMRGITCPMANAFRVQMEHIHLRGQRLVRPVPGCHQMQNGRVPQHQTHAHGHVKRDIMAHPPMGIHHVRTVVLVITVLAERIVPVVPV